MHQRSRSRSSVHQVCWHAAKQFEAESARSATPAHAFVGWLAACKTLAGKRKPKNSPASRRCRPHEAQTTRLGTPPAQSLAGCQGGRRKIGGANSWDFVCGCKPRCIVDVLQGLEACAPAYAASEAVAAAIRHPVNPKSAQRAPPQRCPWSSTSTAGPSSS